MSCSRSFCLFILLILDENAFESKLYSSDPALLLDTLLLSLSSLDESGGIGMFLPTESASSESSSNANGLDIFHTKYLLPLSQERKFSGSGKMLPSSNGYKNV
uniref:Secreted protein n=1 Tax=Cacopsylla melanoneura TaxID=428564 RepID=A0A8D8YAY2_9HEMI